MARKQQVVPECHKALDQWKYEIAAEMGLPLAASSSLPDNVEFAAEPGLVSWQSQREPYWGHIATRDAGAVGGAITRRLIQKAEETLFSL